MEPLADPHLSQCGLVTLFGQPAHRLPFRRQLADVLVTAAQDSGQQTGNLGGNQQQETIAGRLFQCLQQGVGSGLRHALRIRNDHHFAPAKLGRVLQASADLANSFDPYGLAVDCNGTKIRVMSLVKQLARVALATGLSAIRLLAEVQARQSFCKLLLAKTGIPEQQPGVAQPTGLGRLTQGMPIRDQPGIHTCSFDR